MTVRGLQLTVSICTATRSCASTCILSPEGCALLAVALVTAQQVSPLQGMFRLLQQQTHTHTHTHRCNHAARCNRMCADCAHHPTHMQTSSIIKAAPAPGSATGGSAFFNSSQACAVLPGPSITASTSSNGSCQCCRIHGNAFLQGAAQDSQHARAAGCSLPANRPDHVLDGQGLPHQDPQPPPQPRGLHR